MAKRGPKPKGKVKIAWSPDFAYAIGLLVTDGSVSKDGRHIDFTSKDKEQILNFSRALRINNIITMKSRSAEKTRKYYVVQLGDIIFIEFLKSIGITSAKSKTLKSIDIPREYFFHFLRGVLDGDGYVHSYFDPRWRSSFLWYIGFCSASPMFLFWLREELRAILNVSGHVTKTKAGLCQQLKYAKREAIKIVQKLYEDKTAICLTRKKLKIQRILAIVDGLAKSREVSDLTR